MRFMRLLNNFKKLNKKFSKGYVIVAVLTAIIVLTFLGMGLLKIGYGARLNSIRMKKETQAMLAAEAGYEQAIFWMSKQDDILSGLGASPSGTINFDTSDCTYWIQFHNYIGARPIFRVVSQGRSGRYRRDVEVFVMQAIGGWDMGACRVPSSATESTSVVFASGEIIDMAVHINNFKDNPDNIDIHISGNPRFLQPVLMGESKGNKYPASIMALFEGGISFDQPDTKITDESVVQLKLDRFRNSTKPGFQFTPVAYADVKSSPPSAGNSDKRAVQLEFYVDSGVGKVRITNNCTVVGCRRAISWDYRIKSGTSAFEDYFIYAYHYRPSSPVPTLHNVEDTYVTQSFAGKESEPGGQIYVDGNVIIGSDTFTNMVVKGKITVVATGNIWVADNILVEGSRDASGAPADDNPNVLGLIAGGVVKIIDPGLSFYPESNSNSYPGPPSLTVSGVSGTGQHVYVPVANHAGGDSWNRVLPDPTIIEAAVTSGLGGWGAENVRRDSGGTSRGGRREFSGNQDGLILRGTIVEAYRGVVGLTGSNPDGYIKQYHLDRRLLQGALPGNIWFSGKFIPAPAGWHDARIIEQ